MTFKRLRIATAAAVIALMVVICVVLVVLLAMLTAAPDSVVGSAHASGTAQNLSGPAGSFAVFKTGVSGGDLIEQSRLQSSFAGVSGAVTGVDFGLARPAPIQGTPERAWIAPSQDKVCLFVPDPVDGFGATCSTAEDIASGRAIAVLGGGPGSDSGVIVAALVPDGAAPPQIDAGAGAVPLAVSSNVAAAVVPASAKLLTNAGTIDLSFLRAPSARACAVGADCSGK